MNNLTQYNQQKHYDNMIKFIMIYKYIKCYIISNYIKCYIISNYNKYCFGRYGIRICLLVSFIVVFNSINIQI
jgi:hypothetical protein